MKEEDVIINEIGNVKIGKWAGAQPRISWEVVPPEGHATCLTCHSKGEAQAWIDETKRKYPNSHYAQYHIERWEMYSDYDTDSEAIRLLPVLVERGYHTDLMDCDTQWSFQIVTWDRTKVVSSRTEDTISAAITSAIISLLDKEREGR